jgi:MYXO-CTERM domain-containing protein
VKVAFFAAGICALLGAREAAAESCGKPDLLATFPGDGATLVPMDASISAVYAETADYLGEPVTLTEGLESRSVDAHFDPSERRLILAQQTLTPGTAYAVDWPALRGLSSAGHGVGKRITFTTGQINDSGPPSFGAITSVDWDVVHTRDACTDELEPRFRFSFHLGAADDAGPTKSLSLMLFQASGQAAKDGPVQLTQRAFPENQQTTLDLPIKDASGRLCFAAVVRDLVGNLSATGSQQRCLQTTAPPFFYGCSLGRAPAPTSLLALLVFGGLTLTRLRRRKTRPAR